MRTGQRLSWRFYLFKYNQRALAILGYTGFTEAFTNVRLVLGITHASVKNKRDDFDPLRSNSRAGWFRCPLDPNRAKTVQVLGSLSFKVFTSFAIHLLQSAEYRISNEVAEILARLKVSEAQQNSGAFVPRGPTDRHAEKLFLHLVSQGHIALLATNPLVGAKIGVTMVFS